MYTFLLPPSANPITHQNRSLLGKDTSTFLLEVCGKMPHSTSSVFIDKKTLKNIL